LTHSILNYTIMKSNATLTTQPISVAEPQAWLASFWMERRTPGLRGATPDRS
jgi:hypothetical protein